MNRSIRSATRSPSDRQAVRNVKVANVEGLLPPHTTTEPERLSPPTSHQRLQGRLIFLINDEWALTSAGLEATQSDHIYASSLDIQPGISNRRIGYKIAVEHDSPCPDDCQSDLWREAKFYAMLLTVLRK